jgi:hypothetical protein
MGGFLSFVKQNSALGVLKSSQRPEYAQIGALRARHKKSRAWT